MRGRIAPMMLLTACVTAPSPPAKPQVNVDPARPTADEPVAPPAARGLTPFDRTPFDRTTFDCNAAPVLSVADQGALLRRVFPTWQIDARRSQDDVWDVPHNASLMLARGVMSEAPAWMRGEDDHHEMRTRVMDRRLVGAHTIALFTTQARPMSMGHPDAALISAAVGDDPPVVLGLVGEWSQCKGAVHLFESGSRRYAVLESHSSGFGSEYLNITVSRWRGAEVERELVIYPPKDEALLINDCGRRDICVDKRFHVAVMKVGGDNELWLEESGYDVVDGRRRRVHANRRIAVLTAE